MHTLLSPRRFVPAVCVWLVCSATAVNGQPTQGVARVYRGLFGGGQPAPPGESLVLSGSALSLHDAGQAGLDTPGFEPQLLGTSAEVAAEVRYRKPARRATFAFSGATALRHHGDLAEFFTGTHSAYADLSVPIGRFTSVLAHAGGMTSPYYAFLPFVSVDDMAQTPAEYRDSAVLADRQRGGRARVDLVRDVPDRNWFAVRFEGRYSALRDRQIVVKGVRGGFDYRHNVSRRSAIGFGYDLHYSEQHPSVDENYARIHNPRVVYVRDWLRSPTLVTRLTLEGGPWVVSQLGQRRSGVLAGATLTHLFGRSWALAGRYSRGVRVVEGIEEPFVSDSGSVNLNGILGRRWEITLSAAASRGDSGIGSLTTFNYNSYAASSEIRYAVTQKLAAFVRYTQYRHVFTGSAALPELAASQLDRSGVRVGLTLWLPLILRESDGTRQEH